MLKPTLENQEKFIKLLRDEKIFEEDLNYLSTQDFTTQLAFHIGEEPQKIDFLSFIQGVNYDEANEVKNFFDSENYRIPIIHLNHLIISKLTSNRAKDRADVEELQKLNKKNKD